MKSPFPGMDPFIEACWLWEAVHGHPVEEISEHLAEAAPERYLVRSGERSYVVLVKEEGKVTRPFQPDVSITTRRGGKRAPRKGTAVAEPAGDVEPVELRPFIEEEHREAFVEIYESGPDQRL